jgi:hypothetical protein
VARIPLPLHNSRLRPGNKHPPRICRPDSKHLPRICRRGSNRHRRQENLARQDNLQPGVNLECQAP